MPYLIAALAAVFLLLLLLFFHYENNTLDVTNYTVTSDNTDRDFRIVHLSDLHSKPFWKMLARVKELSPELICITGDYINDRGAKKEQMLALAKALCEVAPVYYITGNHERRLDDFEALMQALSDCGFHVLRDAAAQTDYCAILGLDENMADFEDYKARKKGTFVYRDMKPLLDRFQEMDGFKIVLSHFPENFEKIKELNYSQYDFDLQLSGHAHGGQWILPFLGPLFSPGQGVLPKYARGTFGKRPQLIISRGLGNAEFPLRLFNHPEIVVIDVKKHR